MIIASVGRALPEHRYDQDTIRRQLEEIWAEHPSVARRLASLHANTRVATRHLALPLEQYGKLSSFGEANDHWIQHSESLGQAAIEDALARAGLCATDIDALFSVSVTGISSPTLDARLCNRMQLRPDLKRVPIFGLGCVGGAAGVSRAADYLKAFPDQVAVLLSVELTSLTFQREDHSMANMISVGLFGDGAAAVVLVGARRAQELKLAGPRIQATRSVFYPDTEDIMGWGVSERGFQIVLSPRVPELARERLGGDADAFLDEHELTRSRIDHWICHPGGPRVLEGLRDGLGLDDRQVASAWRVLGQQGNLSSTSILMVLGDTLESHQGPPGALGVMVAMGPAFCSEWVLLRW